MKATIRYLTILFSVAAVALIMFSGCSKKSAETQVSGAAERPVISDAERALAMLEVQNTFSKHHGYMLIDQCQELDNIWVKRDGPYGKTAKMTQPGEKCLPQSSGACSGASGAHLDGWLADCSSARQ